MKQQLLLLILLLLLVCSINPAEPNPHEPTRSSHFVLIHGSCHGAWSWFKLVKLLRSSGHKVTALDLAASGVDPKQAISLTSISDYFKPLTDYMSSLNSSAKVVLVGHSLGGLAISHTMEKFPTKIHVAVFVTALMPGPSFNVSFLTQESLKRSGPVLDSRYTYDNGPNKPPTTFTFGPEHLATQVYQLSPIEDWTLATTLMRPQRLFNGEDMAKVIVLTDANYGSVSRVYVEPEEDKLMAKDVLRLMLENNPPDQVYKIKGSDHMVMMSRPLQLWSLLHTIANKYYP